MSGKHGLDPDKFGYLDVDDEVEKLGFVSWDCLACKVPQTMVFKKSEETSEILSTNIGGDGAGEISDLTRSIAREKSVGGDGDVNEKPVEVDGEGEGDVSEKSVGEDYEDWTSEEDDDYMSSTEDIRDGSEKYDFGDEETLEKHVGEDYEDWNSEEDDDYMPSTEDSEDILSDKELPSDNEIQTGQSMNEKKIESEIGSDGDVNSDYEDSDGEVNFDSTGDEADPKQKKEKTITYDPRCDHKSLKLCVGMRFDDGLQCREALRNISIENRYLIHFRRGLRNAVRELAPFAEHRNCARHIYCNWKKQHKRSTLKNIFWRICRSTYMEAYRAALEDLKVENQQAYEDFLEREPQRFCKAFISTSKTLQKKFRAVALVNDILCPKIRTKIENVKYDSREWITHPSVGDKFEVKLNGNHYVVTLGNQNSRTYRVWDLTRIPCVHACSAIIYMKLELSDFVDACYTIPKYLEAYRNGVPPLNGPDMWPDVVGFLVKPPIIRKMLGRPKEKKKRDADEISSSNPNRLKKKVFMTCQRCLQPGHNIRSCQNEVVEKPEAIKGKRGTPRKQASASAQTFISGRASTSRQASRGAVIRKEMALANKGVGVLVCEATGNIYCRMLAEKRAHFWNPLGHSSRQDGTRRGANSGSSSTVVQMLTQENQT
ncbi:hypothetical protein C2S52_021985 [Perilla frutescens var. hirtella]|nr:hypothetical protein C2S52_021985 [Perilla frutescens var. hirtella]